MAEERYILYYHANLLSKWQAAHWEFLYNDCL